MPSLPTGHTDLRLFDFCLCEHHWQTVGTLDLDNLIISQHLPQRLLEISFGNTLGAISPMFCLQMFFQGSKGEGPMCCEQLLCVLKQSLLFAFQAFLSVLSFNL